MPGTPLWVAQRLVGNPAGGSWWETLSGAIGAWEAALAADQATSYVNLVNPGTYDLTPIKESGGPTISWASGTGWSGFRTNLSALSTGIVLSGANNSMMVHVGALETGSPPHCAMGCDVALHGHTRFSLYPYRSAGEFDLCAYGVAGELITGVGTVINGTMALCGDTGYLSGEERVGGMDTTGANTSPIAIGAALRRTVAEGVALDTYCGFEIKRAVVWNSVVSESTILALHDLWAAL